MTLPAGAQLGPYQVLSPLGAGGMGEVYRARDTRLGREVALKVLAAAFADDADRMARFQREAHLLAALNHPGIATIHGLEDSDGRRALVMELVPGPTLAERIAQGALPLEEALPIARQIAEALEYAHEHGVVHRDLKPANVKLTADGDVKVLDFGLAKALADDPTVPDISQSPTLSAVATRAGMILGTAAYMSPEQAKGKAVDRRTDVWSFGVVLYEMLSGRRVFTGETAAETLASVLKTEPDWDGLPAGTPASVRRLLRRCLEKDPRRRMQAIGEARITLEDVLAGVAYEQGAESAIGRSQASARNVWPWLAAAAALALGLGLGIRWSRREAPPAKAAMRLSIEAGTDAPIFLGYGTSLALSPDGSTLTFVGLNDEGGRQLFLRRLDQATASPLAGTENANDPFFSPDGTWIGFFADSKLRKIATTGGAAVALCDAPDDRGGSWAEDGTIFFTPTGSVGAGVLRISAEGGVPEPFTKVDPTVGIATDRWPQALPGGAVLFTSFHRTAGYDDASLVVQREAGGERKVVHRGGYHGRYLRSGHLVYVHKGTLFVAPFDLARLEVTGSAAPALDGVYSRPGAAGSQFAFSDAGLLAYLPGPSRGQELPLQWLDASGKTEVLRATPFDGANIRFSPDGRRLAMNIYDGTQHDVWLYEWERDTISRFTFDSENDLVPIWAPDGRAIAFASARADKTPNLYLQPVDGAGATVRLTQSRNMQTPNAWHPSGTSLVFEEQTVAGGTDLMLLPLETDPTTSWKPGKPTVLLGSPAVESDATFSPDGRWLAYSSNDSGRFEVYVRAFPGSAGQWQVSTGGGRFPVWSRTVNHLFYRAADLKLMVTEFVADDSFRAGKPRAWSARLDDRGPNRSFDLHPDGKRFAVLRSLAPEAKRTHISFIFNFADELRRIAPARAR
jgi:serine/threonine-protein kinase